MNRVSDGDRSTLLSFLAHGASQGYAPQSGEIIGILKVLFQYVGNGTRLALTSMDWLDTREAVILAQPDRLCVRASLVTVVRLTRHTATSYRLRGAILVSTFVTRRPSTISSSTSSSSSGRASLVSSVKTRHVSWSSLSGQTLEQGVCVQKLPGASPHRIERQRVKLAPQGRGGSAFVLVSHSHDKTCRLCVGTKRCWTLAEDIILGWEQRKKSRAGGGAPCESRKTCVILGGTYMQSVTPLTIRHHCSCTSSGTS